MVDAGLAAPGLLHPPFCDQDEHVNRPGPKRHTALLRRVDVIAGTGDMRKPEWTPAPRFLSDPLRPRRATTSWAVPVQATPLGATPGSPVHRQEFAGDQGSQVERPDQAKQDAEGPGLHKSGVGLPLGMAPVDMSYPVHRRWHTCQRGPHPQARESLGQWRVLISGHGSRMSLARLDELPRGDRIGGWGTFRGTTLIRRRPVFTID